MPARSIGPDSALNLFRRRTPLPVNNSTNNKDSKKQENPHSRGEKKGLTKGKIYVTFQGQVMGSVKGNENKSCLSPLGEDGHI